LLATIVCLLEKRLGLAVESVGIDFIAGIVRRHMSKSGLSDEKEYLDLLHRSGELWNSLVQAIVVPETWFFRNAESFKFLSRHAKTEWLKKDGKAFARVLSIPCATGEEPYSIAMTLMDAGISPDGFHIDAMDISDALVETARAGIYGAESFRGKDLEFREKYFEAGAEGFRIQPSVMGAVQFFKRNILDVGALAKPGSYDAIFCRNLLIYLTPSARKEAVVTLDRLLDKDGIIFVGHIEYEIFKEIGFEKVRERGVFACRRRDGGQGSRAPARACGGRDLEGGSAPGIPVICDPVIPSSKPCPKMDVAVYPKVDRGHRGKADRDADQEALYLFDSARKLADQGLLTEASELCKKLLRENALHVQGHFLMGLILLALNDSRTAAEYFNKAAYLDPNHHEALEYLAHIAERDGSHSSAAQLRQRAQRIRARENGLGGDPRAER